MILVAESGSTKCDWVLLDLKGREIDRWNSIGFNPYFHSKEMIVETLQSKVELNIWVEKITQVWFYGAGCSTPKLRAIVKSGLDEIFINSSNHIGHDLEAAAFALYDGTPVIACILGTGSNSCFFDGNIHEKTPSLAYVLGDEGSASYIGKRLIADFLYKTMPKELEQDFGKIFKVTKDQVIDAVYHKPHPNVYLASFGPFAGRWSDHPYIHEIVKEGFDKFIDIHVACYQHDKNYPVSFVGSVAKVYEDILSSCLETKGYMLGRVLAKPINSLIEYHLSTLKVLENN